MHRFAVSTIALTWLLGCAPGAHDPAPTYVPGAGDPRMTAGSLVTARWGHSATRLSDGVLIAGGATLVKGATDTAERVDPGSGVSQPLAERMREARRLHVSAPVQGGAIIFGGEDAGGRRLSSIERYEEATGAFVALAERTSEPRAGAAFVVVGQRLFLAGGGAGAADSLEVWSLDPLRREAVFTLPGARRRDPQLAAVGGRLFLHGAGGGPSLWIDPTSGKSEAAPGRDLLIGGTVFAASFEPDGVLIVGGLSPHTFKLDRGVQVVRPGEEPTRAGVGPIQYRLRPTVVSGEGGVYLFAGTLGGLPVALSERISSSGSTLLPETFGAVVEMQATFVGPEHVLLTGGLGADGRPSALISLLTPPRTASDGGAFEAARAARIRSEQVDANLARVRAERDDLLAQGGRAALSRQEVLDRVTAAELLADALQAALDAVTQDTSRLQQQVQGLAVQQPSVAAELSALRQREQALRAELGQVDASVAALRTRL